MSVLLYGKEGDQVGSEKIKIPYKNKKQKNDQQD